MEGRNGKHDGREVDERGRGGMNWIEIVIDNESRCDRAINYEMKRIPK